MQAKSNAKMQRSTKYYARWFLQYTRYFTHEYLVEEKGKRKWFLPPQLTGCFTYKNSQKKWVNASCLSHQLTGCFTHETRRRKVKTLVVYPPISQVVLPTRFAEKKGNLLRVIDVGASPTSSEPARKRRTTGQAPARILKTPWKLLRKH